MKIKKLYIPFVLKVLQEPNIITLSLNPYSLLCKKTTFTLPTPLCYTVSCIDFCFWSAFKTKGM